ncbi:MAG: SEL1-like repeat protein [Alsobacter sp.]
MARVEMAGAETASMAGTAMDGRAFLDLGIMYSVGRSVPVDRIEAHKWLNIAAARGCREAIALRSELAAEMSPAEIAAAQRNARLWLSLH